MKFETRAEARAGDPLSFILSDMAQNEHLRESSELAEIDPATPRSACIPARAAA